MDDPELSEERRGEIEAMTEYEDDEAEIYTWEFAQKEVQANHKVVNEEFEKAEKAKEAEEERKFEEMKVKIEEEQKKMAVQMEEEKKKYEGEMEQLRAQMEVQKKEELQKEIEETERLMAERMVQMERERAQKEEQQKQEMEQEMEVMEKRKKEHESVETRINQLSPLLDEANLLSKEFRKPVSFSYRVQSVIPENVVSSPLENVRNRRMEVQVIVSNSAIGEESVWDVDKFKDRLDVI